jgi:hypothetical protein
MSQTHASDCVSVRRERTDSQAGDSFGHQSERICAAHTSPARLSSTAHYAICVITKLSIVSTVPSKETTVVHRPQCRRSGIATHLIGQDLKRRLRYKSIEIKSPTDMKVPFLIILRRVPVVRRGAANSKTAEMTVARDLAWVDPSGYRVLRALPQAQKRRGVVHRVGANRTTTNLDREGEMYPDKHRQIAQRR